MAADEDGAHLTVSYLPLSTAHSQIMGPKGSSKGRDNHCPLHVHCAHVTEGRAHLNRVLGGKFYILALCTP